MGQCATTRLTLCRKAHDRIHQEYLVSVRVKIFTLACTNHKNLVSGQVIPLTTIGEKNTMSLIVTLSSAHELAGNPQKTSCNANDFSPVSGSTSVQTIKTIRLESSSTLSRGGLVRRADVCAPRSLLSNHRMFIIEREREFFANQWGKVKKKRKSSRNKHYSFTVSCPTFFR